MIEGVIGNGDKVVKIAENIQAGGTITTIISVVSICLVVAWFWDNRKLKKEDREEKKELMKNMQKILGTNREVAETVRSLANSNIKKDEMIQINTMEFNNVRNRHVDELKSVKKSADDVKEQLEKVEIKQDNMATDIKEIKFHLKVN